jgi:hypothetical protein
MFRSPKTPRFQVVYIAADAFGTGRSLLGESPVGSNQLEAPIHGAGCCGNGVGWNPHSDGEVAKVKDLPTLDHFRKRPYQC